MGGDEKLVVLVSSSVWGKEPLLDQIYATLTRFGYRVWMSYKGTMPIVPGKSAFESCLAAVENCDIFFGLITPDYGSGSEGNRPEDLAITHRELLRAIELGKPRFLLAHENVVNARRLLLDLDLGSAEKRGTLKLKKHANVIDDLRLIDMYEAAVRADLPVAARTDNWVQPYRTHPDVLLYVDEQFSRYEDNVRFVVESRAKQGGKS